MKSFRIFLLTASTLVLSACQGAAPVDSDQSMPKNPVPAVEQSKLDEQRLSMLESRVGSLETDMAQARPVLKKVDAIEHHFKALSLELDRIDATYAQPVEPTPQPLLMATQPVETPVEKLAEKPVAKPVVKKAEKPVAKPTAKEIVPKADPKVASVTGVRIGDQKNDVTRIVLDTTKPAEMHYDLDNEEHLLVIDLAGNKWNALKNMTLKSSPMVKAFHATEDDAGAHLVLELKKTAKVAATARLNPSGAYGHRVYLDLVPSK